jgi:tellurite methyltransferase
MAAYSIGAVTRSVDFFEHQFRRQAAAADYALNPFERAILPHLSGAVLDLGCGMGNLALAAASAGCSVHALDASPTAVADLARRGQAAGVALRAEAADLRAFRATRTYDCVACVGLLMFFDCAEAKAVLQQIKQGVRAGGVAAVNVLIEGTTYMEMFDPSAHCLFAREALPLAFPAWQPLYSAYEDFPAPGGTLKRFHTYVARRPR